MPTVSLTQVIDCSVADVFAAVVDFRNYPRWDPPVRSARGLTDSEPTVGSEFELDVRGFGTKVYEITDFETDRVFRSAPRSERFSGGHKFTFVSEAEATRVDHELVIDPKGVLRVLSPVFGFMARRGLADAAAGLKDYCEKDGGGDQDGGV